MMKRLLPVAAAVVLGLSPSFASAQGKVSGAVKKGTVTHSAVEHAMHDLYGADFGTGNAFSLATGRLSMAWGAAASWVHQTKNDNPYYINTNIAGENQGDAAGNRFNLGADLDMHFKATSNVDVRMTLSAGPTMRGNYFADDDTIEPSGGYANFGADELEKAGFKVENLYMTYQYNPAMGALLGWHTSGMTTATHLGANHLLPTWSDLLEYTGIEAGVRYQGNGITAGLSLLDPGTVAATLSGINSRAQHSSSQANPNNWIGDIGYDGKGGNFSYGVHIKRMKYAEDLTLYQAMGGTGTVPVRGVSTGAHHVTSYELSGGTNNFDAGFTRVEFEGDTRVSNAATGARKKWDLWHVGYKAAKTSGNVFYNKAHDDRFGGLGKDEYGVQGSYAMSAKMSVNATLKHQGAGATGGGNPGVHHANQFALGVSLKS
jgi:hypothetical protein